MRDDNIQGILFSKSQVIDLVQYKRRERVTKSMLAKKHALQRWSERQQQLLKEALQSEDGSYAVGKKHHDSDVIAIQVRLKDRT